MQQFLSAERLIEELQNVSPNFDFISFFRHHLNIQDHKPRTHKNHTSVLNKLMEFSKEIPFHKIDESFFANYRKWCTEVKKNKPITYNSDVKTIKKYLNIALDKGIVLNINLKKLKINVHSQKRIYLQKEEVARLKKYSLDLVLKDSVLVGNKTLRFSEFDIVPPKKFGGMVSVKDDLNLAVSLKVKP